MDIEQNVIAYKDDDLSAEDYRAMCGQPERTPVILYSIGFKAEELLAVYAGMRAYLKALAATDSDENLGMILRVTQILLDLNPQAVKASKSLASKADPT